MYLLILSKTGAAVQILLRIQHFEKPAAPENIMKKTLQRYVTQEGTRLLC